MAVTAIVVLLAMPVALCLGAIPAWIVHRYDFRFRSVLAPLQLLGLTLPAYVLAGTYQEASSHPFFETRAALALWYGLAAAPYVFLLARAALARLPQSYGDTAAALGASLRARIVRVDFPLLRTPLLAGMLLVAATALSDIATAERVGITTLAVGLRTLWMGVQRLEVATLISALVLTGMALVTIPLVLALDRHPLRASGHPGFRRPLGRRETLCCQGICVAAALPGFLAPTALNLWWTLGRLERARLGTLYADLGSTLMTAGGAVALAVALTLPFVFLSQGSSLTGQLARKALWLPTLNLLLPSLLMAMAFLALTAEAGPLGWLGDSRVPLISGVTLRALPFLCLPLLDALNRTPPTLLESARSLGKGPGGALVHGVLPSLVPAFTVGLLLVFLEAAKELDLSQALQPFGYTSLSLRIFSQAGLHLARDAAAWVTSLQLACLAPALLLARTLDGGRHA